MCDVVSILELYTRARRYQQVQYKTCMVIIINE